MTTIFEPGAPADIRRRLDRLTPTSPARWGTMDVAQMLCHVARSLHTPTGALAPPLLPWPLRLVGRLAKRRVLRGTTLARNAPTSAAFKVADRREFAAEKAAFLEAFRVLEAGPHVVTAPQHVFFGPMTPDEWGQLMYRHVDHHFRQFGV